jgi:hypothetical protein
MFYKLRCKAINMEAKCSHEYENIKHTTKIINVLELQHLLKWELPNMARAHFVSNFIILRQNSDIVGLQVI